MGCIWPRHALGSRDEDPVFLPHRDTDDVSVGCMALHGVGLASG